VPPEERSMEAYLQVIETGVMRGAWDRWVVEPDRA
jgi:hypothetical protein